VIAAHQHKKSGRKPMPEHLPRVESFMIFPMRKKSVNAALSECCEKLDYIPAKVRVLNHIRYQYARKNVKVSKATAPRSKLHPVPINRNTLINCAQMELSPDENC
jgi:transposase